MLSIPAQIRELKEKFTKESARKGIIEYPPESMSAKAPGRPIFNQLIDDIESGKVNRIFAWHPDRLVRNSVDGGRLIYLLDTGKLIDLKFGSYTFENTPEGKWMLGIVFGQSKYFVDKLSKDVKRGNREKYEQGGITFQIGPGYAPDLINHSWIPDPERYEMVRKMWDMLLTGTYTVPAIWRTANNEWGFRTRKTKKQGGKSLSLSTIYKMFKNLRYCGIHISADGTEYRCSYQPMVSEEEFWRAQTILGRKGRARPQKYKRAYTDGMIRCAECGCSITAEDKIKISTNGKVHNYTYYRCTKKKGYCSQPYIEVRELERQIDSVLAQITIPESLTKWALKYLRELNQNEQKEVAIITKNQNRELENSQRQLGNLIDMRARELINDEEFLERKAVLIQDKAVLREKVEDIHVRSESWLELAEKVFDFASHCRNSFAQGTVQQKKEILFTIAGSNLTLLDKKINIQPVGPYKILAKSVGYSSWQGY